MSGREPIALTGDEEFLKSLEGQRIRVAKRCPCCGKTAIFSFVGSRGPVELKCPNCGKFVEVDMTVYKSGNVLYRRVSQRSYFNYDFYNGPSKRM